MSVRTGARAPQAYVLNLAPIDGVDLSTVESAELRVRRPDFSTVVWAVTLSNQTSTTLRLTHVFDAADLVKPGPYSIYAQLVLASDAGELPSEPRILHVKDAFDASP